MYKAFQGMQIKSAEHCLQINFVAIFMSFFIHTHTSIINQYQQHHLHIRGEEEETNDGENIETKPASEMSGNELCHGSHLNLNIIHCCIYAVVLMKCFVIKRLCMNASSENTKNQ